MFSFFLVSFFFGLLCRAGFPIVRHTLVKQESNKISFPQLETRGHSDPKKKNKKHSYSSKVQVDGEPDRFREFERIQNADMNLENAYTHSSLIHGFCFILFTLSRNE